MKKLLVALGMVALLATSAFAQSDPPILKAEWTPPTEGSPVVNYHLQISVNGGEFVTLADNISGTNYSFTGAWLQTYVGRVAGIDEWDRQGPWSLESVPYTPDRGWPGAPGLPVIEEDVSP